MTFRGYLFILGGAWAELFSGPHYHRWDPVNDRCLRCGRPAYELMDDAAHDIYCSGRPIYEFLTAVALIALVFFGGS